MSAGNLESPDYDRFIFMAEKAAHEARVASNDAFILAMTKAVRRGREKVTPGTFVDTRAPIKARRIPA